MKGTQITIKLSGKLNFLPCLVVMYFRNIFKILHSVYDQTPSIKGMIFFKHIFLMAMSFFGGEKLSKGDKFVQKGLWN